MKKIGFIAGESGIVKYDASVHAPVPLAPKVKLTKHQRLTLYLAAMRYIQKLLCEVGFKPVTLDSHSSFTIELGSFMLEMTAAVPPPMAHVTSHRGYLYDPDQINAKVTRITPGEPGEYLIRIVATLPNQRSLRPMYVAIPSDSTQPMKEAFFNALSAARDLIGQDANTLAKIKEAMAKRDLAKDFERFMAQDQERQIGD